MGQDVTVLGSATQNPKTISRGRGASVIVPQAVDETREGFQGSRFQDEVQRGAVEHRLLEDGRHSSRHVAARRSAQEGANSACHVSRERHTHSSSRTVDIRDDDSNHHQNRSAQPQFKNLPTSASSAANPHNISDLIPKLGEGKLERGEFRNFVAALHLRMQAWSEERDPNSSASRKRRQDRQQQLVSGPLKRRSQ